MFATFMVLLRFTSFFALKHARTRCASFTSNIAEFNNGNSPILKKYSVTESFTFLLKTILKVYKHKCVHFWGRATSIFCSLKVCYKKNRRLLLEPQERLLRKQEALVKLIQLVSASQMCTAASVINEKKTSS